MKSLRNLVRRELLLETRRRFRPLALGASLLALVGGFGVNPALALTYRQEKLAKRRPSRSRISAVRIWPTSTATATST